MNVQNPEIRECLGWQFWRDPDPGGTARVVASPSQEQHEQDYSKNKNYQQGMRDGKDDFAHNRDHSKKRHFKVDDDQKAYEAGYESGHQK